ncbi:Cysteine desulfurase SufS [Liberibacter crescens BT-1]|uniref:Cysteine desulfurase n=1 Tax=Liberibacter crescens (strain BT-1) TaxID=1215343 RepID=L0EW16_LIBCB|nr:cysteine desulfurase [Liberibacter crescens]AGA64863.1 Cysteine desulfurase SufS [Liberibacter crescens BT-1]AMC12907.1 cysteine desulfurase [Liberibacter crescens]
MTYDIQAIRQDFPILAQKIYGKPLIYLDNAASAQKPQVMIDTIVKVYCQEYSNVHRGIHFLSNAATEAYEAARGKVCRFMNTSSPEEIVFTKSSTEAINTVAYSWGMENIREGDEIVLSIMEHHSNIVPWHFLRERCGAKLIWIPVDSNGVLDIEEFTKSLTERTKLVAITHVSNVLGTKVPIKDICRIAHEHGVPVLVDGSQGAVHVPLDVRDLDCDWYTMTGHKLYGPSGIGVLYGKEDRLQEMRPFMGGGEMIIEVDQDSISYNLPPYRFEAGTPPIVQAIALGASLDYIESIGRDSIFDYEEKLAAYVKERLMSMSACHLVGNASERAGIFSFQLGKIHSYDLAMLLDKRGIAVRSGSHCAQPLLKFLGINSLCRVSFSMYNTHEEVDKLIESLEYALHVFN